MPPAAGQVRSRCGTGVRWVQVRAFNGGKARGGRTCVSEGPMHLAGQAPAALGLT